jgi:hypothetical protein
MQIWVSVRQNGSELAFDQCQDRVEKSCTTDDLIPTHRHLCRKDQCENLLGNNTVARYMFSPLQREYLHLLYFR